MRAPAVMRITVLMALLGAIVWMLMHRGDIDVQTLQTWVQHQGSWGVVAFIGLYAVATVIFMPGLILTIAGGALFGPVWGTLASLTGATLGATLAFLVSRYLVSDWVLKKTGGRLKQIIEGVESEGWRFVALVRLVPLFPFNVLNYTLGLTRIKLSHYIIASYICMFPGALAYSYLGYAGREAAAGTEGALQKGLLALGLLAFVVFLPRLLKRFRKQG